jgi:hypothetical protein
MMTLGVLLKLAELEPAKYPNLVRGDFPQADLLIKPGDLHSQKLGSSLDVDKRFHLTVYPPFCDQSVECSRNTCAAM